MPVTPLISGCEYIILVFEPYSRIQCLYRYYNLFPQAALPNVIFLVNMLTESYDILTARESIATVRARSQLPEEEDNYESMEDDVSNYMYVLTAI